MRAIWFLIILVLACASLLPAQAVDRQSQAKEVKTEIGKIASRSKPKIEIVLRDLREVEGKVIGLYPYHFVVKAKDSRKALVTIGSRSSNRPITIKYADVLQIQGKDVLISFVPDPKKSPYAAWDDVRAIGTGEFVHVETIEGKKFGGVFMSASNDSVSLMRGNTKSDFEKKTISRVYRVRGDRGTTSAKLLKGGQKGRGVTEDILPILDPRAWADPTAVMIGTGIGMIIYLLPKGTKGVLVFSQ
jgi:hypothetical protein